MTCSVFVCCKTHQKKLPMTSVTDIDCFRHAVLCLALFLIPGWAGSQGDDKCSCGQLGSCVGGSDTNCNCDLEDGEMRSDSGWLLNKDRLAVCEVCVSLDNVSSLMVDPQIRRARVEVSDLVCDVSPTGGYGQKHHDEM